MDQPFRARLRTALLAAGIAAVAFQVTAGPAPVQASDAHQIALGVSIRDDSTPSKVDAFAASIGGHLPAIWSLWSDWLGRTNSAFPSAMVTQLQQRGVVPLVFWQPDDPQDQTDPVITYSKILAGQFDNYIRSWAQAARDAGGPVLVRFAHEMEGDWFPWGVNRFDNTPAKFIAAWQYIVTLFRSVGATNVKWVWSPYTPLASLYPGDDFVDYVGFTAFNWGGPWRSMDEVYSYAVAAAATFTHRPLIAAETGSTPNGGDKAAWIANGYNAVYNHYPSIAAIVYFDVNMGPSQADWRLTTPHAALTAYTNVASDWRFQGSLLPLSVQLSMPKYSRSLTVPLAVSVNDAAGHGIRDFHVSTSATPPSASSGWSPNPPTSWTFSGADGKKLLHAWARSNDGSISPMATVITHIDRVQPVASLMISPATKRKMITVKLSGSKGIGSPITGYIVRRSAAKPGASDPDWRPSSPTSTAISPLADGTATLYGWVRDQAGNISAPSVATTVYDTTAPSVSVQAPASSTTRQVPVSVSGSDAGTGVTGYYVSQSSKNPVLSATGWQASPPSSLHLSGPDGSKTVYAWTRDRAGNVSARAAAPVNLEVAGGPTTYASDDFTRTVANGLGTAPIGGAWATSGGFSVDGSAAVLANPPGQSAWALLSALSVADQRVSVAFTLPSIPQGSGSFWLYLVERQSVAPDSSLLEYRLKVHIDTSGQMWLGISKVSAAGEVDLTPEQQVAGLNAQSGHTYRVLGQLQGQQPALRLRVWDASASDPGTWQVTASDTSGSPLPTGAVGFRTWLSSGVSAPLALQLDDYAVTSVP